MSLQVQLALEGNLRAFSEDVQKKLAYATKYAIAAYGERLKLRLREDTRAGGLGDGVANAWRANDYSGGDQLNPAVLVYSKAPLIVTAFSADTTIAAKNGHLWLAIPTDNVPRIGNHKMSPQEVEIRFNQDLKIVTTKPGAALAFVSVIPAKSGHGFRPPTPGRVAQGRKTEMVLMFVMVQQVHLRKRLDWPTIFADAKDEFERFLGKTIETALED
jgi:hypothetical protein